ncbi:uncharacterized protein FMAN_14233 [Fusarium mangiferae]|uniref:Uncharacterized protein n=1 Tax=Fusarium mangiferae TaxID=192010 RepID=A0A1L7UI82_FUSMA|nr:uncharacterized protein FMAN_14233 [Fusarium mangiferae]CVL08103.1 uncharacterized protein FMAN_14233 [Fusarium mangiferae]
MTSPNHRNPCDIHARTRTTALQSRLLSATSTPSAALPCPRPSAAALDEAQEQQHPGELAASPGRDIERRQLRKTDETYIYSIERDCVPDSALATTQGQRWPFQYSSPWLLLTLITMQAERAPTARRYGAAILEKILRCAEEQRDLHGITTVCSIASHAHALISRRTLCTRQFIDAI